MILNGPKIKNESDYKILVLDEKQFKNSITKYFKDFTKQFYFTTNNTIITDKNQPNQYTNDNFSFFPELAINDKIITQIQNKQENKRNNTIFFYHPTRFLLQPKWVFKIGLIFFDIVQSRIIKKIVFSSIKNYYSGSTTTTHNLREIQQKVEFRNKRKKSLFNTFQPLLDFISRRKKTIYIIMSAFFIGILGWISVAETTCSNFFCSVILFKI